MMFVDRDVCARVSLGIAEYLNSSSSSVGATTLSSTRYSVFVTDGKAGGEVRTHLPA